MFNGARNFKRVRVFVRFFPPGWESHGSTAGKDARRYNSKGTDLMTNSPATVEPKQRRDLHKVKRVTSPALPKVGLPRSATVCAEPETECGSPALDSGGLLSAH